MSQPEAVADTIVTIDGPSGAGKSTAARLLAESLGYLYVDTGAMYRAVAVAAARAKVAPSDEAGLSALCAGLSVRLMQTGSGLRVLLDEEDVSQEIRLPEVGSLASAVSARRPVREAMWGLQRALAAQGRAVFEGRDTGTVVLPWARWKFYLTAAPKVRAQRRWAELAGRRIEVGLEEVLSEMLARDEADASRELAPLKAAADAVAIDSSGLDARQVVGRMLEVMGRA